MGSVETVVPVAIYRITRRAANFEKLAAVGLDFFQEPTRREPAEFDLIDVHRDCSGDSITLSKDKRTTPAALARLTTGAKAAGFSALTMTAS